MLKAKMVLVIASLALVSVANGAFVDQWAFPYFDNTNGNPYTDGDGNQWEVYQAASLYSTNFADFTLLPWDAGNGKWGGDWYPAYWPGARRLVGANENSQVVSLVFTPAAAGIYSFYGPADFYASETWGRVWITVKKFTGSAGASLLSTSFSTGTVNLNTITELQNIALTPADKVALSITAPSRVSSSVQLSAAGIGLVPEPLTMSFLGLGSIGLFLRRK